MALVELYTIFAAKAFYLIEILIMRRQRQNKKERKKLDEGIPEKRCWYGALPIEIFIFLTRMAFEKQVQIKVLQVYKYDMLFREKNSLNQKRKSVTNLK